MLIGTNNWDVKTIKRKLERPNAPQENSTQSVGYYICGRGTFLNHWIGFEGIRHGDFERINKIIDIF